MITQEMCSGSGMTSNKMGGHFSSFRATGIGSFGNAAWCFANELFVLNAIPINEKGKIIAQKKLPSNQVGNKLNEFFSRQVNIKKR
jgi:hypothetical protein